MRPPQTRRLEERVASKLTKGIADRDATTTRLCLEIYDNIGRRDVMIDRFVDAARPKLEVRLVIIKA